MKRMVVGFVLLLAGSALAGNVVVKDGERAWTFVEVDGTSRLPIRYMLGGADRDNREEITLARYWIAERMVTEGDFAAVMGRPIREGQSATNLVTMIEWEEAREYCERFTKRYAAQFPTNTIASVPTMLEWAHAVRVLDGRVDFWDRAGTFLFTCSPDYGYLHTLWKDGKRTRGPNENLAWDFAIAMKRQKLPFLGLRMVLIDVTREMMDGYHPIGERASVMVTSGQFEAAQDYLKLSIARGNLASNVLEWCEGAIDYCKRDREEDHEDWSGLVARSAAFAEKRGYVTEPFAAEWMYHGWERPIAECVAAYERAGITGAFVRIGDLPSGFADEQIVGKTHSLFIKVGERYEFVDRAIDSNTVVQVLTCDFTGDGRKDRVVETYGAVGADGYFYAFYQQMPDGTYKHVGGIQAVGLCALPRKDGGACGFLVVYKSSNPVLYVRLLTFEGGEATLAEANMRSFYMLDASEDQVYTHAPFIGAGYGLGWRFLEGRGTWYRPLFWPWKPGEVQGYAEAVEQAKRQAEKKGEAAKRVEALEAKWPHAAERVSMWAMPDYAKRFREIDDYQHNVLKRDGGETTVAFEKMCREAIAMKIEPPVWYYNLACTLSLQNRPDEAFEALGQAIAAGYGDYECAAEDEDFANLRADPRFAERLEEMKSIPGCRAWTLPSDYGIVTNECLYLTADLVYFDFNKKGYWVNLEEETKHGMFYMDCDCNNGAQVGDFCAVRFDEEGVRRGRNRRMAPLYVTRAGCDMPIIVRGTFRPEEIKTDAFDAEEMSKRNVLGLYSAEGHSERLSWCILYKGGEAEGAELAQIIHKTCLQMAHETFIRIARRNDFATELVAIIHMAMKEGTDGNVIDVKNIDRERLRELAENWAAVEGWVVIWYTSSCRGAYLRR